MKLPWLKNGDFHWSFSRANRQPIHAPITPIISFNMNHILPNHEVLILTATHSTAPLKMARFACTMQGLFSTNLLISNTTTETHHIHVNHLTWLAQYSTNMRASHCPGTLFKLANKKDNIWFDHTYVLFHATNCKAMPFHLGSSVEWWGSPSLSLAHMQHPLQSPGRQYDTTVMYNQKQTISGSWRVVPEQEQLNQPVGIPSKSLCWDVVSNISVYNRAQ